MSMFNGDVYNTTIVPARLAPDGETAEEITVTREVNGYAIWHYSCEGGSDCLQFNRVGTRDQAIDLAISIANKLRAERGL